jgi:hypothetical protein
MATYPTIGVDAGGGDVLVRVCIPAYPQALAANLWKYKADKTPEGKVGSFTTGVEQVNLGPPSGIQGHLFLLEGSVIGAGGGPGGQYQVKVSIVQGTNILHDTTPPEGGHGQIDEKDVPFSFRFGVAP